MKKIGILGGSFNPPHISHLAIVKACLEKNLVNEVWVLPTYNHPHKNNQVSFEHRIKMCKLIFPSLFGRIKVKRYEEMNISGRMYDMIAILRFMFEKYNFSVIIGRDCADHINTWANYESLIQSVPFIIFERGDYIEQHLETWYLIKPHQMLLIKNCECSSTYIRKLLSRGNFNCATALTNKKIVRFIKKEKLYENIEN